MEIIFKNGADQIRDVHAYSKVSVTVSYYYRYLIVKR